MERKLAVLDEWDRRYGVGGAPPGHPFAEDATTWRYHSPSDAVSHRAPRRRRTWPGVLAVLAVVGAGVALVEFPDQTRAVTHEALEAGRTLVGVVTGEPYEASRAEGGSAGAGADRASGAGAGAEGAPGTGADGADGAGAEEGFRAPDLVDLVGRASPFGWSPPAGERVLPPVEVRDAGSYAFVSTQPGTDLPVGFSPCGVVEVEVNPDRAPRGYEGLVEGSLERLTRASGLQLTLVGETTDTWEERSRRPGAPVVIGWADAGDVPELAGQVAGLGGALTVSGPQGTWAAGGRVVLDVDADVHLDDTQRSALLDHELGHVLGLDHVDDQGELMAPTNRGRTSFGPGDLAGLARLGAIPCP